VTRPVMQLVSGDSCLRVIQITDTHLNRAEGGTLLGLNTDFSLQHVIALARGERERVDLVLATGDISDHGAAEAYRRAGDYLQAFAAPIAWLPGNHDCADTMSDVLGGEHGLDRAVESDNWLIVMLNSQIPGEVDGQLGQSELDWLQACLAEADSRGLHCLVCLHHQPLPMGSDWIDQQMVKDHAAFFACIEQANCVRGVLWGHVHQQLQLERDGVLLMSTPSSCIQFAPGSADFKVDDQSPGYRWLDLHADGRIETGVSRVSGVDFEFDLDSSGYL